MNLNKTQTKAMMEINSSWSEFVREDGISIAEVTGSSGALWNEDAVNIIKSMGLKQSVHDPCVFFKQGITFVLYIDDLFITYRNHDDIDLIQDRVVKVVGGDIKLTKNRIIKFADSRLKISMPDKIEEVTQGVNSIPYTNELFKIDPKSPVLEKKRKE